MFEPASSDYTCNPLIACLSPIVYRAKGKMSQEDIDTIRATILHTPTYTNDERTGMGSYGTILTIMCLAGVFEINIIVWNSMRRSVRTRELQITRNPLIACLSPIVFR